MMNYVFSLSMTSAQQVTSHFKEKSFAFLEAFTVAAKSQRSNTPLQGGAVSPVDPASSGLSVGTLSWRT